MGRLDPNFEGETVIVTGSASGIGREVALRFGGAGASVVVADLDEEPKDGGVPTHERIEDEGGTAAYVETDVTDRDQLEALVEAAREFGGVDVMVNNAGLIVPGSMRELTPADVAPAYLYLASEGAGYVTGELLFVDGGWQVL